MKIVRALAGTLILAVCGIGQAATIRCIPDGDQPWVSYVGGVAEEDPPVLRREFARCFDGVKVAMPLIRLSSGGGLVSSGLDMAHFIASMAEGRGVRVEVAPGESCISACTFLFISGSHRVVPAGAKLEPHGFSSLSGQDPERLKDLDWANPELRPNLLRLSYAAQAVGMQLAAENRAAAEQFLGLFRCDSAKICQSAFRGLDPQSQKLLAHWDGVLRSRYIDLERSQALAAMYEFGKFGNSHAEKISEAIAVLSTRIFGNVMDQHLGAQRPGRKNPTDSGASDVIVRQLQNHLTKSVHAADKLWKLIQRKSNELDAKALVDLMFSTSILYTRPLTREEMCDTNVVNVDC